MELWVQSIQMKRGAQLRERFHEVVGPLIGPEDGPGGETLELMGPVDLDVVATNLGSRIGLEGRLRAQVKLNCSRCAQDYVVSLDEPIQEFFVRKDLPAGQPRDARANAPGKPSALVFEAFSTDEEEEPEELPYWGHVIHLDDLVRETVLLAVPMKPVCHEACQGLCPVCGGNRNERPCTCQQDFGDPRLAPLKRWMEAGGHDPLTN